MRTSSSAFKSAGPVPGALHVRVPSEEQWPEFDGVLGQHHYLGAGRPVGDYLRQVVERAGQPVALLVWGPAGYALKDRDRWISWSANQRLERLKLIVQNRRFLLLTAKGQEPNLASQALGAALRALPAHWQERFGYRPLLAESFTDPEAYAGTCYKASNWEPVGFSAGYRRHRADFYVPNERPKKLWLYPLDPDARARLRAVHVPEDCRAALSAAPSGTLPLPAGQVASLLTVLRHAPDPREANTRYRIGPVLTLVALALLAGRREIAEIARFATTLTHPQRHRLGLPRQRGRRRFYQVPGYGVFYQVLTRLDPEAFAGLLTGWLKARAGTLPAALAGRREIAEIARFATTLTHPQRHRLGLPLKTGTRGFYQVPGYGVFYQVLTRLDPEAFAGLLTGWLKARAGTLPAALALDGKMIRDHIGLLTLAQHEDGAPQAVAVYDQKENTPRCEQTAAAALVASLPALDGKLITADPLHCQRALGRSIVEKGGDYLLGIKGNQPKLLQQAQGLDDLPDTPFLATPKAATDGCKPGACTPLPSSR